MIQGRKQLSDSDHWILVYHQTCQFFEWKLIKNEEINQISTEIIASRCCLYNQSIIHNYFNVQNIRINPKTYIFKDNRFWSIETSYRSDFQSTMDLSYIMHQRVHSGIKKWCLGTSFNCTRIFLMNEILFFHAKNSCLQRFEL